MEIFESLSLVSIFTACFLAVFLAIQIFIDAKDIGLSRHLYRELVNVAKKNIKRSFTVIIEMDRTAGLIFPIISYLSEQNYPKLEILVVIAKTAEPDAKKLLTRYAHNNHVKRLKIVDNNLGLSMRELIRQQAKNEYVIILNATDRLSDDFFSRASVLASFSNSLVALLPGRRVMLNNSLTSAFQAQRRIFRQLIAGVFNVKIPASPLHTGIVYDRILMLEPLEKKYFAKLYINQRLYILSEPRQKTLTSYFGYAIKHAAKNLKSISNLAIFTLIVAPIVAAYFFIDFSDWSLILGILAASYVFASLSMQFRLKGYSFVDHLCLILITPISLILTAASYIVGIIFLIPSLIINRKSRKNFLVQFKNAK